MTAGAHVPSDPKVVIMIIGLPMKSSQINQTYRKHRPIVALAAERSRISVAAAGKPVDRSRKSQTRCRISSSIPHLGVIIHFVPLYHIAIDFSDTEFLRKWKNCILIVSGLSPLGFRRESRFFFWKRSPNNSIFENSKPLMDFAIYDNNLNPPPHTSSNPPFVCRNLSKFWWFRHLSRFLAEKYERRLWRYVG